jgi:hypothetical protein
MHAQACTGLNSVCHTMIIYQVIINIRRSSRDGSYAIDSAYMQTRCASKMHNKNNQISRSEAGVTYHISPYTAAADDEINDATASCLLIIDELKVVLLRRVRPVRLQSGECVTHNINIISV